MTKALTQNMGPATKDDIESFAAHVLTRLRLSDSVMRWTTAGDICLSPHILIDDHHIGDYVWRAKEVVLHEVAHLLVGNGHGQTFYDEYAQLLIRFMVKGDKGRMNGSRLSLWKAGGGPDGYTFWNTRYGYGYWTKHNLLCVRQTDDLYLARMYTSPLSRLKKLAYLRFRLKRWITCIWKAQGGVG